MSTPSTRNLVRRKESIPQNTKRQHDDPASIKLDQLIKPDEIPNDDDYTSSSGSDSDSDSNISEAPKAENPSSGSSSPTNKPETSSTAPSHMLPKPVHKDELQNRLTSFFSQLAEQRAHPDHMTMDVIEENSSDSGYEDNEDEGGKQYVELDLALGVLSEVPDGVEEGGIRVPKRRDDRSGGESDGEEQGEEESGDRSVLDALTGVGVGGSRMGETRKARSEQKKRKIEEVG